ncbi:MAG TPA: DUF5916 domain-containing protein, partial [Holophagaceae bacterium]|nr:DUF5916 domain-containing protein [Holophagaceae bacterium]
ELVRGFRHKRDDFSGDQDFVGLDVDPTGKGQSCIRLLVTPLGGQFDAIVTDSSGEDYSYDLLWDSVGVSTPKGYVVKLRVPYSSLRRAPGEWGIRMLRIMPRERRYGIVWPKMSRDIQCDICQMAKASGAPLDKAGAPFMLIPFAAGIHGLRPQPDPAAQDETHGRLGVDVRYAGTAVTLEGTYRPDFNAVDADVDPLQINSRFKVFFPEHRPFFLEGMELLNVSGAQRQFFSRTVSDPLYGVKASGSSSFANWTVLHAKDEEGNLALMANGGTGVDGLPTRDTAAAVRFKLDDRGSGVSVVGTDTLLLGGPENSGGQSGGLYVDKWIGPEFHFIGSGVVSQVHLPQADGTVSSQHGEATALELDWNTRRWSAWVSSQRTSPGLVLVSGFTDLQGYRRENGGFGWHDNWNQGFMSRANATIRAQTLTWWNGDPLDRTWGLDAYAETAGRWALSLNWDVAGRTWANDHVSNNATRNINMALSWKQLAWAQLFARATTGRTIDLSTGEPALIRSKTLEWAGSAASVAFDVMAKQFDLNHESDGTRLIRARELVASGTWQLPQHVYVKVQSFVVRYDGTELDGVDKYIKALVGWQPNAFSGAYIGWSGQRQRDPFAIDPEERMIERSFFAKLAWAFQF